MRAVALYLIVSLLVFFLDSRNFFSPVRRTVQRASIPATSSLYAAKQSFLSQFSFIGKARGDAAKVAELEEKLAELAASNASLQAVKEENEALRKLLGSPLPPSWKFSPARLVRVSGDLATIAVVDQAQAGIPAIVPAQSGGILVGRVDKVLGQEAVVKLPTHPDSRITANVRDKSGGRTASGILSGVGGFAILDQVLTAESLQEGDLVLTSGDAGFPPDLLIGEVAKVLTSDSGVAKKARVKTLWQPDSFVFLLTKY